MAAVKVLSIPELLEEILLDLSTRDILFAQKIIDTTPSLQRALFFVPARDTELSYYTGVQASFSRSVVAGHILIHPGFEKFHLFLLNPLLVCEKGGYMETQWHNFELLSKPLNAGTESSCNRMYLSQPPTVVVRSEYDLKNKTCYSLEQEDRLESQKFGDLIAMRRMRASRERMAAKVKPKGLFKSRWTR
ncbi:hypothetical protein LTR10_004159 [Elasticomyces elasticus]|nr:hypothetical protein LTR10_004159 [Elasticomyces elasticus]